MVKYMPDSVNDVRLADRGLGIAFAVHSVSPLGAIIDFENTLRGYVVVFELDQLRIVWFDPAGNMLTNYGAWK